MALVEEHVPCAHLCWPVEDDDRPLPWAVYLDEPEGSGADGEDWAVIHHWTVELYEKYPDTELEGALFGALRGAYGYVEPPETVWIETEGCARTIYRFSEIERI